MTEHEVIISAKWMIEKLHSYYTKHCRNTISVDLHVQCFDFPRKMPWSNLAWRGVQITASGGITRTRNRLDSRH